MSGYKDNDHTDGAAVPEDPIVAEVRAAREAIFAEAGYDLDELVRRLRLQQEMSGHAVITRPPRPAHDDSAA
jgi:hypothetical protein